MWEYLLSVEDACDSLGHFETRFCLVGHSHVPLAFVCDESGSCSRLMVFDGVALSGGGGRWIVNPGGVGQPRDGDPRASYAMYDSETGALRHYRVQYDIAVTQRKMRKNGLPPSLSHRLGYGY